MIVVSRSLFLSFIISFVVSCSFNTSDKKDIAVIQETLPVPTDSPTYYFPIDSIDRDGPYQGSVEFFVNSWYSKMPLALHKPVLYNYMGKEERFTWLRTFDNPASIRIQKHGNNIRLFAKVNSAAGGFCKSRAKEYDLDNISLVNSAGNRFVNPQT